MKRLPIDRWTIGCLGLPLLLILGFVVFVFLAMGINDSGSLPLAKEWGKRLASFESPEAAQRADRQIFTKKFPDGDWVIGLSQDSHGLWPPGGGTMVLRDSQGGSRIYFGHVCGPDYLQTYGGTEDLKQFYERLDEENTRQ